LHRNAFETFVFVFGKFRSLFWCCCVAAGSLAIILGQVGRQHDLHLSARHAAAHETVRLEIEQEWNWNPEASGDINYSVNNRLRNFHATQTGIETFTPSQTAL
jgi:hypothetical protein